MTDEGAPSSRAVDGARPRQPCRDVPDLCAGCSPLRQDAA
jgi:hypothetical protein